MINSCFVIFAWLCFTAKRDHVALHSRVSNHTCLRDRFRVSRAWSRAYRRGDQNTWISRQLYAQSACRDGWEADTHTYTWATNKTTHSPPTQTHILWAENQRTFSIPHTHAHPNRGATHTHARTRKATRKTRTHTHARSKKSRTRPHRSATEAALKLFPCARSMRWLSVPPHLTSLLWLLLLLLLVCCRSRWQR